MTRAISSLDHRDQSKTKLDAAKDAVQRFVACVAQNRGDDIVLIGSFGSRAKIIEPARSAENLRREMSSLLAKICSDGTTNTAGGVKLMHESLMGVRKVTSRRMIILTDGFSDDSRKSIEMACRAKQDGIVIEIIGVGERPAEVNEMELKEMCSIVDGRHRYWYISQADELVQRFQKLAMTLREF